MRSVDRRLTNKAMLRTRWYRGGGMRTALKKCITACWRRQVRAANVGSGHWFPKVLFNNHGRLDLIILSGYSVANRGWVQPD